MRQVVACILTGMVAVMLAPGAPAAPAPEAINYQGVLRDASGAPLDGSHDMTFRLFDTPSGGTALYTDEHLASGAGGVVADGGLFNVAIGTGVHQSSLAEVFTTHIDVWVEIEINGEVLSPRTQVRSAAHALNAGNAEQFDGLSSAQFLRADQDSSASGALTATELRSRGDLFANVDGPDGDSHLYFHDGTPTQRYLKWNDLLGRFETSSRLYAPTLEAPTIDGTDVRVYDDLYFNWNGPNGDANIYFHRNGSNTSEWIRWNDFADIFQISKPLLLHGTLQAEGNVMAEGNLLVNVGGPEGDGNIYFHNSGLNTSEWIRWYDFGAFFEASDSLLVHGIMEADGQVRAGGDMVVNGQQLTINNDGPDMNQDIEFYNGAPQVERFQWDATALRFEVSDDFHAFGEVSGTVKNFVQNHPNRDDLEIVYTSLEGNEVTTFTRGSGRLVNGEARIELEESFRHVTNPDIGLSVHLTPRGPASVLYAESISTSEVVVRSVEGGDVAFDFVVYGLRIGFEDFPVYRPKRAESFVPPQGHYAAEFSAEPGLAEHTALWRYRKMAAAAFGRSAGDMPGATALREAIGMRDPNLDYPRGSDIPVSEMNRIALEAGARDLEADVEAPRPAEPPPSPSAASTAPPTTAAPYRDAGGNAYARSFRPSAGELASLVPVREPIEAGDVLVVDPRVPGGATLARFEAEPTVFGVVATDPGVVLGAGDSDGSDEETGVPVAVSGIVLCKVDASLGAIRPGDLLQTSPNPGHAMRAEDPQIGTILGKALEPLDGGTGLIRVLVMLR